jgi:predicted phosphodiesterase
MNRKTIFSIIVCLFVSISFFLNGEEKKLIRFGIITDTHVCDKDDQSASISINATPRYYTGGPAKIEAFAKAMNKADASFIIELGDFTDNPKDTSLTPEKRKTVTLTFVETAESKFNLFKGPKFHLFGNHDTDQMSKEDFSSKISNTGIKTEQGKYYFSWTNGGVHFIVLDAGYKSNGNAYSGIPGSAGAGYTWDDANIPKDEIKWLKDDLSANKLPTIVFTHQLLNPQDIIEPGFDTNHIIKNAAETRSILEGSGQVLAVFSGHYHDGGCQTVSGLNYVVLQANAAYGNDASYHNQYATVEIYKDEKNYKIDVKGNGMQKNYILNAVSSF